MCASCINKLVVCICLVVVVFCTLFEYHVAGLVEIEFGNDGKRLWIIFISCYTRLLQLWRTTHVLRSHFWAVVVLTLDEKTGRTQIYLPYCLVWCKVTLKRACNRCRIVYEGSDKKERVRRRVSQVKNVKVNTKIFLLTTTKN